MDKFLNLLGLAYKAKKIVLGEEIFNQIKKVKLIIIANDISEKSRIRYEKKRHYYQIEMIDKYSSKQLSIALGKSIVKTIGIIDQGFAESILKNK